MNAISSFDEAKPMSFDRYGSAKLLAQASQSSEELCVMIFRAADDEPRLVRVIRSSSMVPSTCRTRQAIVWAARTRLSLSYYEIGKALNRDHSTILYSFRIASALIKRDPVFKAMCERIAA